MKNNYSKAEEAFTEAMQRLAIEKLIIEAATAQKDLKPLTSDDYAASKRVLLMLNNAIKHYSKIDRKFYKTIGFKHEEVKKLLTNPNLSSEDWKVILQLQQKVHEYKEKLQSNPGSQDEKLIEAERVKHVNKRYNIKETWLPLH